MSYHSEQHLLYGAPKPAETPIYPGRDERLSTDKARIVITKRIGDEPQYRYFANHGEAHRAAKALRRSFDVLAGAQYLHADGRWIG